MHQTAVGVGVVIAVGFSIVAIHGSRGDTFTVPFIGYDYKSDGITPAHAGLVLLYALQISMFLTMLTMML